MENEKKIVNDFHKLFYGNNLRTWDDTYWMGVRVTKNPLDLWIYQEIIFNIKPDLIIECGTKFGGSALFFANMLDLIGKGKIISIDLYRYGELPKHDRIDYWIGESSTSPVVTGQIESEIEWLHKENPVILVNLDSDHSKAHVLKELEIYSKFVTVGSYLILEDTNVHGHPVNEEHPLGPMEALEEFLKTNNDFMIDKSKEKYYLTFNPNGYLKKIK